MVEYVEKPYKCAVVVGVGGEEEMIYENDIMSFIIVETGEKLTGWIVTLGTKRIEFAVEGEVGTRQYALDDITLVFE